MVTGRAPGSERIWEKYLGNVKRTVKYIEELKENGDKKISYPRITDLRCTEELMTSWLLVGDEFRGERAYYESRALVDAIFRNHPRMNEDKRREKIWKYVAMMLSLEDGSLEPQEMDRLQGFLEKILSHETLDLAEDLSPKVCINPAIEY